VPGAAAGPAGGKASARGALADASRSDSTGCFGMRLAKGMERRSDNSSSWLITSGIAMPLESTIIERVETLVRHPVFAGSDQAMDLIIADLQAMVEGGRIHQATHRKLCEMILNSPHFAGDN
jgi:hypothetical protein